MWSLRWFAVPVPVVPVFVPVFSVPVSVLLILVVPVDWGGAVGELVRAIARLPCGDSAHPAMRDPVMVRFPRAPLLCHGLWEATGVGCGRSPSENSPRAVFRGLEGGFRFEVIVTPSGVSSVDSTPDG